MKTVNSIRREGVSGRSNWILICFTILSIIFLGGSQAFSQKRIAPKKRQQGIIPGQYIVTFQDYIQEPGVVAERLAKLYKFGLRHVYKRALKGFSAKMTENIAEYLKQDPDVAFVEPDRRVYAVAQTVPTGVMRIQADQNSTAQSSPVDVDVAIIDTGIDLDHPDLNVVENTRCTTAWGSCMDGQGDDDNGHGTHVAGTVAALDNDLGVLGVAPGARLWAVKVLDRNGSGYLSWVIKGIDWVTAHAAEIEVANLSLSWQGNSSSARQAMQNSVAQGVVYVVAASNEAQDVYGADGIFGTADDIEPASYPEVATISAMCDTDGQTGGTGAPGSYGADDSFASFSNFSRSVIPQNPVTSPGAAIDLSLPGVDILSTYINGSYAIGSGTSMASPHAAGLAALYIAENGRASDAAGVYAIRQALIDAGVEQDNENGLSVLNDPDGNWERLGWAGTEAIPMDVAVTDVIATPNSVFAGDTVDISVTVRNVGTEVFNSGFKVTLVSDNATPDIPTDDILIGSDTSIDGLEPGDPKDLYFSWTTPETAFGDHIITASITSADDPLPPEGSLPELDDNPDNDSRSTAVEVMNPDTPTTLHVGDLDGDSFKLFWRIWGTTTTVTVHNSNEEPVANAAVFGIFSDGSTVWQCTTNEDGQCTMKPGYQVGRCLTFSITNVQHPDYEYMESYNHDPDGDSDGTEITTCRP